MHLPDGSTGIAGVDSLVVWISVGVAMVSAVGLLWRVARGVRRVMHRAELFWDDWEGVPKRPGVAGRPGVMERLDRIEHELHPNSGTSLRDVVNRIEGAVTASPEA